MVSVIMQAMPLVLLIMYMHFTEIHAGMPIEAIPVGSSCGNINSKTCQGGSRVCGKDQHGGTHDFENKCKMRQFSCQQYQMLNAIKAECNKKCPCESDNCFHDDSKVMTSHGPKNLRDVGIGEEVLTVSDSGCLRYEPVIVDLHRDPHLHTWFYKIQTQINQIMVTPKHFLYIGKTAESSRLVKAEDVRVGDLLIVNNNSSLGTEIVTHIELTYDRGISDPLVSSGKILVNNILAAVYADDFAPLKPKHLHSLIWLSRMFSSMKIDIVDMVEQKSGMPYWTAYGELMLKKFIPFITKN